MPNSAGKRINVKARASTSHRAKISDAVILQLWARSGGRCQYRGCNSALWTDHLTLKALKRGEMAHIIGASEKGARGSAADSEKLAVDLSNLMLLCRDCHGRIDTDVESHPVSLLQEMKATQELLVELALASLPKFETEILMFSSAISANPAALDLQKAIRAVLKDQRYPTRGHHTVTVPHTLPLEDEEDWKQAYKWLSNHMSMYATQLPSHVSVFGLARIPLLILLGKLLGDKVPSLVYQPHPDGEYAWPHPEAEPHFEQTEPELEDTLETSEVVLKLEVTACVSDASIQSALNQSLPMYVLKTPEPGLNTICSAQQVEHFADRVRSLFEQIGRRHGSSVTIHLFAAVPCALAVELGKAHRQHFPQVRIYEYLSGTQHFRFVLDQEKEI